MKILRVVLIVVLMVSVRVGAYSGGDGTEGDPYQIGTSTDWEMLMDTPADWGKHFVLISDVDLDGIPMIPVGNILTRFTGVIDGAGYRIRNAAIEWPEADYVGLFGYVSGGRIANLRLVNACIRGHNAVGGLVGLNSGEIVSCCVSGDIVGNFYIGGLTGNNNRGSIRYSCSTADVSGNSYLGGLAGRNDYTSTITACFATGDVSATNHHAGGLTGYNYYGTIVSSHARGDASGAYDVGGLVGHTDHGAIDSCYATGRTSGYPSIGGLVGRNYMGSVSNSFWDVNTSERQTSAGGTGKTTTEMQMRSTFVDAEWDFVDTWAICEETNYPRLQWAIPSADFLCPDGIDWPDFAYFAHRWLLHNCTESQNCGGADLTEDGRVDLADFAILGDQWLK